MSPTGKNIRKAVKIVLIAALMLCVLAVAFFFFMLFHGVTKDMSTSDLTEYEDYLNIEEDDVDIYSRRLCQMPELEDCGAYIGGTASLRRHRSMFPLNGYALFLNYDEEEYQKQCAAIGERYSFLTEPTTHFRDIDAVWNGFFARPAMVYYPWEDMKEAIWGDVNLCLFIGFDDASHRIMYACYSDTEIDAIDDLNETMDHYFFCPKELRK